MSLQLTCQLDRPIAGASQLAPHALPSLAPRSTCKHIARRQAAIEEPSTPAVSTSFWQWRGHTIRYQQCGTQGPAVLLIHGFGANCDHWRKNLPVLGQHCRVFAIDLLGYGYSDKPDPRTATPNSIYNFENWGQQALEFLDQVVGGPAIVVTNSVGGLVGLQAALQSPTRVPAVMVINISLRMLHVEKQAPWQRPLVATLQRVLRESELGRWFFGSVAKPQAVRNILQQCYANPAAVTDELVDVILKPGLQPGAADVFLDFISYSGGPTPEALMRDVQVPVSVVWGAEDPWEKVEWGRAFKEYASVEEYVELAGVGHCPQDEAPDQVNPLVLSFVQRHGKMAMS